MADSSTRRTIGIVLVALTLVVFVVQIVALALGQFTVAAVCAVTFVFGWFALRSWQKHRPAE